MASFDDAEAELESWRQVHRAMVEALKVASAAVAAQKAQRRYWLEEICANLNSDGAHQNSSIWKRPQLIKRPPGKRGSTSATKRKKPAAAASAEEAASKPAKKARTKKSLDGPGTNNSTAKQDGAVVKRESSSVSPNNTESRPSSRLSEPNETTEQRPEYGAETSAYPSGHGAPPGPPQWPHSGGAAGTQNLQMMAAVAFGANPANYATPMMQAQATYPSYYPPTAPPPHPVHPTMVGSAHPPPPVGHHHYRPRPHGGSRTYASLEDVGNSDDDDSDHNF